MIASLSADEGETLLYIRKDDKSVIALVSYNYSDMDGYIGSYVTYIKKLCDLYQEVTIPSNFYCLQYVAIAGNFCILQRGCKIHLRQ